ncbi:hypothetical protein GCM10010442_31090 [Kitasatospora kifunensis]
MPRQATFAPWRRPARTLAWLLFVILVGCLGGSAGSHQVTDAGSVPGQVAQTAEILDQAGLTRPPGEIVLVQSATWTTDDPAFRTEVDQVIAAVDITGKTADLHSPYDTKAISADRHSALVQFSVVGDSDQASNNVTAPLTSVAAVQRGDHSFTVAEFGEASSNKWFADQFKDDSAGADWTAVPLALGILLIAFGALVVAGAPPATGRPTGRRIDRPTGRPRVVGVDR